MFCLVLTKDVADWGPNMTHLPLKEGVFGSTYKDLWLSSVQRGEKLTKNTHQKLKFLFVPVQKYQMCTNLLILTVYSSGGHMPPPPVYNPVGTQQKKELIRMFAIAVFEFL